MCFKVACKECGKVSWGGCGKHLQTLCAAIEQGQHCMCKPWPGVVIPNSEGEKEQSASTTSQHPSTGTNHTNQSPWMVTFLTQQ
uniref:Uncharacterized protein n=1 Tax=Kalanchoe fedtschenkoi TaxID=63787 RepID=A0A7N0UNF2_KALFE